MNMRYSALFLAVMFVAGCAAPVSPLAVDYGSDQKTQVNSELAVLQLPPDLIKQSVNWNVSSKNGETRLSDLEKAQQQAAAKQKAHPFLTPLLDPHIQIHRAGNESWLVVDNQSTEQLWPQIKQFLTEQGFTLVVDQPEQGILETDWFESRPDIDQGFVRDWLVKGLGNSYIAAMKNKYRIRVQSMGEKGTDIFISQSGLVSQLDGTFKTQNKWVRMPTNPTLESEYLRLLMQYLIKGSAPTQPAAAQASQTSTSDQQAIQGNLQAIAANASTSVQQNQDNAAQKPTSVGQSMLTVDNVKERLADVPVEIHLSQDYDHAWFITGMALSQANFTIDQADKAHGIYTIRYVNPYDLRAVKQGFWSQLFNGKIDTKALRYRINVKAITPTQTRIAIVDNQGALDESLVAKQIMNLLIPNL